MTVSRVWAIGWHAEHLLAVDAEPPLPASDGSFKVKPKA